MAAMTEGGQDIKSAHPDMVVAVLTVLDLLAPVVGDLLETPGDAHAGELETALVMHLAPDLVKGTSPREFPGFPAPILVSRPEAYWPGGVWGDPGKANAAKGQEIFRRGVDALVALVEKVNAFEEKEAAS